MKSIFKLTLAASVAMLLATGCSKSNGSSSSNPTPLPNVSTSGTPIDGYLVGATVFSDCSGDKILQVNGEPYTITNADGNFSLSIPDSCKYATLIASGGLVKGSNLPFTGVLMATPPAKNITPLTTLVVANPSLQASLMAMGIPSLDVDYTTTPIPGDALRLAMQVATLMNIIGDNTKVTDNALFFQDVLTKLASSLDGVDLSDKAATKAALSDAAVAAFVALGQSVDDLTVTEAGIKPLLNSALEAVNILIPDNTPSTLTGPMDIAIKTAITTATDAIAPQVISPYVITEKISFGTNLTSYLPVDNLFDDHSGNPINVYQGDINTSAQLTLDVNNSITKDYTISLTLAVADTASKRSANFTVSNVEINTTAGGHGIGIKSTNLTATVTGTDGNGDLFDAIQLTGDLSDVLTVDASGILFTLNTAKLLEKVNTGTDHPLSDFYLPGVYGVTVTMSGDISMEYPNYIVSLKITP